jgi:hypothetical protein
MVYLFQILSILGRRKFLKPYNYVSMIMLASKGELMFLIHKLAFFYNFIIAVIEFVKRVKHTTYSSHRH